MGTPYAPPVIYQQQQQQPAAPYPPYPQQHQQMPGAPPANAGWGAAPAGYNNNPYPPPYQQQPYAQAPYQQQPYYPQQQQQQQPPYDASQQYYAAQQPPPPQQQPYYAAAPSSYAAAPPPAPHGGSGARRRKALLVGCSYPGTAAALNGCINDVQCMKYCLETKFGFASFLVLRDDARDFASQPTRANIARGIQWLMADQQPGDSLFFHFSGHGSQKRDRTGQESDGLNETILPTDHSRAGQIVDDELNAWLVRPLRQGVTLHVVIDACHSGTALDLPFMTSRQGGRFVWQYEPPMKGTSGGTAFQFGACKDSQVAADTNAMSGTAYTGAATYSFIDAVERYGVQQTYASLLQHMYDSLHSKGAGGGGGGLPIPQMGGLAGLGMKLVASFLLGPAAMGGQTPVMCCDKQLDLYNTVLCI